MKLHRILKDFDGTTVGLQFVEGKGVYYDVSALHLPNLAFLDKFSIQHESLVRANGVLMTYREFKGLIKPISVTPSHSRFKEVIACLEMYKGY